MKRDDVTLDPRTQAELCDRVEALAASYTPEWNFDREDPDVGSTLALLYTGQMAENIRRLNRLPEKYHTEFVNLMGLSLLPAYPAAGVAVARLIRGTVPGTMLPSGSRLMADTPGGDGVYFETTEDVYLTNARITDILTLSGELGRIIPVLGGPKRARLVPAPEAEVVEVPEGPEPVAGRFALFDMEEPGVEKNALLLYHRNVFHTEQGVALLLRPTDPEGNSLAHKLADLSRWRWSYYDGSVLVPFEKVEVAEDTLLLHRGSQSRPLDVKGTLYHVICLEALGPVEDTLVLGDLRLASKGEAERPQVILREGEELESDSCMPFGDTVSLFDECYIGDDRVFSQQGATVTLSFRLSAREKMVNLSVQQAVEELKIIKRKPRAVQFEVAETAPQRITVEYFNGTGWRKLPCSNDCATLMDGTHSGEVELTFQCPDDWRAIPVGGFEGRCLRFRVVQADNCYLMPCRHTMPCMEDITLSYAYEGQWKQPQQLRTVCGTVVEDRIQDLLAGRTVDAFKPLPYPPAALYLGFDRPLAGAPISILFDVEENVHFRVEDVTFEYATREGFKPLKVVDGTRNFSGSGTILFMPPTDFAALEVEGLSRWWLRIYAGRSSARGYHPVIRAIALNALNIRNQQTLEERSYYVSAAQPDMEFPLGAENILSAEVFVNELGQLPLRRMEELMTREPQNVRVQRDFLGEITEFFVRWTEVTSFDESRAGDRHYMIDRMNNTIRFGDGVHVQIPRARQEVAFTVRCVSCDGAKGNLPAGAVSRFAGNAMYVESVVNPVATYAGDDLESADSARRRGADLLSNRGRLISQADFTRAVRAFSGSVEKVRCLAGRDIDGREDPSLITIALMTRDYKEGAYAFNNIRTPLRRHLLSCCDAAVTPDCLVLSEPVYVDISVSVWVKVDADARPFDVQNLILDAIDRFLEPLRTAGSAGWDIGTLPTENQLRMVLQALRFQGRISRIIAVGRYVDRTGAHEAGLDQLPRNPFAIGVNGDHQIHIEFQ